MPSLLEGYQERVSKIIEMQQHMEELHVSNTISVAELQSVYESLFLRAVAAFEQFCDDLFHSVIDGRLTYPSTKLSMKVTFSDIQWISGITLQGKPNSYLDWLPYRHTKERGELYFKKVGGEAPAGRPIIDVTPTEVTQLDKVHIIRNAIAHDSRASQDKFRTQLCSNLSATEDRTVFGFLRKQIHGAPNPQTRFEVYMGELGSIAQSVFGNPIA